MADRQAADLISIAATRVARRYRRARKVNHRLRLSLLGLALGLTSSVALAAEEGGDMSIHGTISIDKTLASSITPDDRLIIKIYHPGEGVDHDPKYVIKTEFDLPIQFRISPPIDMNARARWPNYVVEAFTDKDADILSVVDGELFAGSDGPMTLGTQDLVLDLKPRSR